MTRKDSGARDPGWSRRRPEGNLLALGVLLVLLLGGAVRLLSFRTGGVFAGRVSGLFAAAVLLAAVGIAAVALGAAKRRRSGDEEMHADHERRTRGQRPRGSADPCAYSERHSRKKSREYDDPWDF